MKTQDWTFKPRPVEAWGDGPWNSEPDKRQWLDTASGLPCMIRRSPIGANWCGYVGVPPGHPLHGRDTDACDARVSVHGGVTLCTGCEAGADDDAICHLPEPGDADDVWWIGFDCGHAFDLMPAMAAVFAGIRALETDGFRTVYRDQLYVEAECRLLAAQLAALRDGE